MKRNLHLAEIKRNLHFADNQAIDLSDKFAKVRPPVSGELETHCSNSNNHHLLVQQYPKPASKSKSYDPSKDKNKSKINFPR